MFLVTENIHVVIYKGSNQDICRTDLIREGCILNGSVLANNKIWVFLDEDGEGEFFFPLEKTVLITDKTDIDWDKVIGE